MKFGSVCSGIEAASVAWEPLGWRAAWLAEIEPFPSAVLAHRYPQVPNLGDMTAIAAKVRAGAVEAPDILVGGTPCQAFSVAGARAGLADPRGQLTLAYVDLANALDTARSSLGQSPIIAVWENVPGVLSSSDNAFGCFLGALAGEGCELKPPGRRWTNAGCVYGPQRAVAWRVLDAQYFGLAQRRRRVFVVASARDGFDPAEVLFEFNGVRRDSAPRREAGEEAAAGTLRGTDGGSDVDHARSGHLVAAGGVTRPSPICFSAKDYGADATFDLSPTLRAGGHQGSHANAGVMPAIAFDSRQDLVSSRHVFGALGSSSPQAQAVCVTGDITHTLKAEGFDAIEDGTGRGQPIVPVAVDIRNGILSTDATMTLQSGGMGEGRGLCINALPHTLHGMQVRRLMPIECERLQGFPDGHTDVQVRGKPAADGPRYKALGNSMATRCMAWIGLRIAERS